MPMAPIDEDDVGFAVVGDGVGGTVKVSNVELIVPTSALYLSKVSVSLNPCKNAVYLGFDTETM